MGRTKREIHNYFFRYCDRCGSRFKPSGKCDFICDECDCTGLGKVIIKKKALKQVAVA